MKKNKLEKLLWSIANATFESTSNVILYEPEIPEKLVKKENKKEQ